MATLGDGFKTIFLAGIGAVAIGAEKGKDLVDQLVAHGEMTVEQGKQINSELKHKANEVGSSIRRDSIEARMSLMTPDERIEFANIVREMADSANAKEAEAAAERVEAANAEGSKPADPDPIAGAKTACATAVAAVSAAVESVANGAKSVLDEAVAINSQKATPAEPAESAAPAESADSTAPVEVEVEAAPETSAAENPQAAGAQAPQAETLGEGNPTA